MKQRLSILSLGCFALLQGFFLTSVTAQVTPDGTTSTTVDVSGNDFTIQEGNRAGGNLFHSFSDFSVPTDGSAFFNNTADIVNIFSRVTGSNISNINGLLGANGTANLFLINPAGIIFGEGARLDLGGSFYGSTADSIVFSNGEFSATDLVNPPLITINAPIGLNLRDNPGDITVADSNLAVDSGQNLALIGGEITLDGARLNATGGRVELGASIAETVTFNNNGGLSFERIAERKNISISNNSVVNVNGQGGGFISLYGRNLDLTEESSLTAGIGVNSANPEAQAGNIVIDVSEAVSLDEDSIISNNVGVDSLGNAGDIEVSGTNLSLINDARIVSISQGKGNTGNVIINASENVTLENGEIKSQILDAGQGNGGNVEITTVNLFLENDSFILSDTQGIGNAGNTIVNAFNSVSLNDSAIVSGVGFSDITIPAQGDGGDIEITANSVELKGDSQLIANTRGQGNAGQVIITAQDSVKITEESNISSRVRTTGIGDAGGISITGSSVLIDQRSILNSGTVGRGNGRDIIIQASETFTLDGDSVIIAQVNESAIANAGNIEITANYVELNGDSAIIAQVDESAIGNAGNIEITANSVELKGDSQLIANTRGQGNAGQVIIAAQDSVTITEESNISSRVRETGIGDAGGISITAKSFSLEEESIFDSGTVGQGNGGKISINAPSVLITDDSRLKSETTTEGNAGNISITNADLVTVTDDGRLTVRSTGTGNAGNIEITAHSLKMNQGDITAETASGELGNINLTITEDIILRNNSLISARALGNANGGNITIEGEDNGNSRFIIAFPSRGNGNDIVATAERGIGGNITINARQLFNLQEGRAIDADGNLISNNRNDIDASSQAEGLDGSVSISTPDTNPIEANIELPKNLVESGTLGVNACSRGGETEASSFIVKGKGGVPPQPTEPFMADSLIPEGETITLDKETDLTSFLVGETETVQENPNYISTEIKPIATSQGDIYPARGVIKTEEGKIILTAYPTDNINTRTPQNAVNCTSS